MRGELLFVAAMAGVWPCPEILSSAWSFYLYRGFSMVSFCLGGQQPGPDQRAGSTMRGGRAMSLFRFFAFGGVHALRKTCSPDGWLTSGLFPLALFSSRGAFWVFFWWAYIIATSLLKLERWLEDRHYFFSALLIGGMIYFQQSLQNGHRPQIHR